jgi:hypothetical protein
MSETEKLIPVYYLRGMNDAGKWITVRLHGLVAEVPHLHNCALLTSDEPAELPTTKEILDAAYEAHAGSEAAFDYSRRHGIVSAAILTVYDDATAATVALSLAPRITGKTVVEVGGGIGLLALHMGLYAKQVFCIEANPIWSSCFLAALIEQKPKNVSYLFGAADEFAGLIHADVALFCTHSGVSAMRATAAMFAPVVIDVWGEALKEKDWEGLGALAVALRETT